MSRRIVASLLALVAACALGFVVSCSTTPTPPPADLAGPNALAIAGKFLFVASTGGSQLRVLTATESNPVFLRAPNPLYALSIPTAPMPTDVATFGRGAVSPLVFALSTVQRTISVAATSDPRWLANLTLADTVLPLAIAVPAWSGTGDIKVAIAATSGGAAQLMVASVSSVNPPASVEPIPLNGLPSIALGNVVPSTVVASPTDANIVAVGNRVADPTDTAAVGGITVVNIGTSTPTPYTTDVDGNALGSVVALAFAPDGNALFGVTEVGCEITTTVTSDGGTNTRQGFCSKIFRLDMTSNAVVQAAALVEAPPRGIAVGRAFTIPESDRAAPVDPLVLLTAADGWVYAVDGATLDTVKNAATGLPYRVGSATLTQPGAIVFLDNEHNPTEMNKSVFFAAFEGINGVVRLEPDKFSPESEFGLTLRR